MRPTLRRRLAPSPRLLRVLLGCLVPLAACGVADDGSKGPRPATTAAEPPAELVRQVEEHRALREARLAASEGWLSLVGLHWLEEGETTFGSGTHNDVVFPAGTPAQAGTFRLDDGELTLDPAPGAELRRRVEAADDEAATAGSDGEAGEEGAHPSVPVSEPLELAVDTTGAPTILELGDLVIYAIERGGDVGIRIKDRKSEALAAFDGLDYFPIDPAWRIEARLEPDPGTVAVPNVLGQISDEPSPGRLVFEVDGEEVSLRPIGDGDNYFLVFGDRTNGRGSYGGGRFLGAQAPAPDDPDQRVILDFNLAESPPCAFSPHATCPLPPPENKLPVAIEAGEKSYAGPGGH